MARIDENPGPAQPGGNPSVLPGPDPGGPRPDPVRLAFGRRGGRRERGKPLECQLCQHVEPFQRLVVGDVFLRLAGLHVGQGEIGREFGHGATDFPHEGPLGGGTVAIAAQSGSVKAYIVPPHRALPARLRVACPSFCRHDVTLRCYRLRPGGLDSPKRAGL